MAGAGSRRVPRRLRPHRGPGPGRQPLHDCPGLRQSGNVARPITTEPDSGISQRCLSVIGNTSRPARADPAQAAGQTGRSHRRTHQDSNRKAANDPNDRANPKIGATLFAQKRGWLTRNPPGSNHHHAPLKTTCPTSTVSQKSRQTRAGDVSRGPVVASGSSFISIPSIATTAKGT